MVGSWLRCVCTEPIAFCQAQQSASLPSMAPKEIGQAGSAAASPERGQRRRLHVKPTVHVEAVARLSAARAEAKKVLKDVRSRQKQEAKKHRRLMAKACKLSVTELKQIAEMKQTLLGGAASSSGSPGSSCSSAAGSGTAATAAIASGPSAPPEEDDDADM